MKKVGLLSCIVLLLAVISGCTHTIKGTDELIQKARKELPIVDSDTIDIVYAGMYAKDNIALLWFIAGNEYQSRYYLPMEYKIVKENEYIFKKSHMDMERVVDIGVVQWSNGYCFLVNNQSCRFIQITDASNGVSEISIEIESYPYIYYYDGIPSKYLFLDTEKNEIK